MKIGFGAPVSGLWATPANLTRIAQRAEQLGYHSLWTFQRLLAVDENPYRSVQDPTVTLAYLAGLTRSIRLGVAVINMPFFSPAMLAKQMSTLDILCGHRLDLGLGNGWNDAEFEAAGATKESLGKRSDEYIALLRALLTQEHVSHSGRFYRVHGEITPRPAQAPPLLLGGLSEPALRRAGRLADGWISSSRADLSQIGNSIHIVRSAAEGAGRDPSSLRYIVRGVVHIGEGGQPGRRPLSGSEDEIRSDLQTLADQGITEVFIDLNFTSQVVARDADPDRSMELAERLLEEFAP